MLRSIIMVVVMFLITVSNSYANTVMWYWRDGAEIIQYTVNVDDSVGTQEMNNFNSAITTIARSSEYSNLDQLEKLINRSATGSIRDFRIVDVVVDEK